MSATASMVNDFHFEEGEAAVRGVPDNGRNDTDGGTIFTPHVDKEDNLKNMKYKMYDISRI